MKILRLDIKKFVKLGLEGVDRNICSGSSNSPTGKFRLMRRNDTTGHDSEIIETPDFIEIELMEEEQQES